MCRTTLFGQIGDFLLISRLQVLVLDLHLVEEGRLLQFDVVEDDLLRAHELLGMLVVMRLDFVIGHFDRRGIGRQGQRREITGLLFEACEGFNLCVGYKSTAGNTCTYLTDEHFLTQHLAELQTAVTQLANDLIETVCAEFTIHLKFRRLQKLLIQCRVGKRELGIRRALQQQLAVDQALER